MSECLIEEMTEHAYRAYEAYMRKNPAKSIDFESFSIGFLLGAYSAVKSVKRASAS